MNRLTHLGGARATIGVPLALLALGGEAQVAGAIALSGNALSHLAVQILKRAVARPRPCDANGVPLALISLPDPFSFPSGHSAAAFSVAIPVALAFPWLTPVVLVLATLVAASRVSLRVHYLSDVIAGVALGIGGFLTARFLVG